MVTRWGMSEKLGPVTLSARGNSFLGGDDGPGFGSSRPYSEETARTIDAEVQRILEECYVSGLALIRENRSRLDALARVLLEKETLDEDEILEVTGLPPRKRPEVLPPPAAVLDPAVPGDLPLTHGSI
jgi:cell division protease FtsH